MKERYEGLKMLIVKVHKDMRSMITPLRMTL